MRSLTLCNCDRALHVPLGRRRALEADVGLLPEPEVGGFTKEEALAALLNEPEPPCPTSEIAPSSRALATPSPERSTKDAPMTSVAVDLTQI
jgi:hypothetical protein